MNRTLIVVALLTLVSVVAVAQRASLAGTWDGGSSGGPISAQATWRFHGTTYDMRGYPSIGEEGTFAITSDTRAADGSHALALHFTRVRSCGPCDAAQTLTASDDRNRTATLSADGNTLTMNGMNLARQP